MIHCHICAREKIEACNDCSQTAGEVGTLEVIWNGFVAMAADCSLCTICDGAWLRLASRSLYICEKCRRRELHVNILPTEQVRAAAARA
jgi:hypothetical protein